MTVVPSQEKRYARRMWVLVTGAAGFIGSHLVRRLVALGYNVSVLVRPRSNLARIEDLLPQLKRIEGDMLDAESIRRCIDAVRPSGIFHLAASNIQSGVTAGDEDVVRTNILGMQRLLDASKDLPYTFFIHTGSYLEYGPKGEPMRESDVCAPLELYSISKLAATLLAQAVGRGQGKPIITLRIFTPYGPALQPGRLVEQVIRRALRGDEIPLSRPTTTRDFLFVEDIVDLFIEAMDEAQRVPGEIFNAGSGRETTLQELVEEVLRQTGSSSTVRWNAFPTVLYDTATCRADMQRTLAHFSWRPRRTLGEGLEETIAWFRKHP